MHLYIYTFIFNIYIYIILFVYRERAHLVCCRSNIASTVRKLMKLKRYKRNACLPSLTSATAPNRSRTVSRSKDHNIVKYDGGL